LTAGPAHRPTARLFLALVAASCAGHPPDYLTDQAEAAVYGAVLEAARLELHLPDTLVVHAYLASAVDSAGHPGMALDEFDFEYEASAALRLLEESDSTLGLCSPGATGRCREPAYLVLSRVLRFAERDAMVMVIATDEQAATARVLRVLLRYRGESWSVAGTRSGS
jgi:hypothetical protein